MKYEVSLGIILKFIHKTLSIFYSLYFSHKKRNLIIFSVQKLFKKTKQQLKFFWELDGINK